MFDNSALNDSLAVFLEKSVSADQEVLVTVVQQAFTDSTDMSILLKRENGKKGIEDRIALSF